MKTDKIYEISTAAREVELSMAMGGTSDKDSELTTDLHRALNKEVLCMFNKHLLKSKFCVSSLMS